MSVTAADHNLVNNVLQPLTNGDDVADLDVRHEMRDASTSSKENSEVKSALLGAKDNLADDIVAKATVTDSAAEALLLLLESNGDLEAISTTEPSEESREEAQVISSVNGEHTILSAVDAKEDSTQDTPIEPSIEVAPSAPKEPAQDTSAKPADPESTVIEPEPAVNSSVNNDLTVTESDDTGLPVPSAPSLEDATEANKDTEIIPPASSTINAIDTHPEQATTKTEDNADVSASASHSEDAPTEVLALAEAAVVPSSNKLEESVSIPKPELSKTASHDQTTIHSDPTAAVPTSIAEPQDAVPAQVAAEEGSHAEENVALDAKHIEAATPIISDALPSKPTAAVETVSTSAGDASIPTAHEPVAAASEEVPAPKVEEALIKQEIEKSLAGAEDDVEQAPPVARAEESASASAPPPVEAQAAKVGAPVGEEAHVREVPVEAAVVEEAQVEEVEAAAPENASATTEAPAAEAEDAVVLGDAPVVAKAPVVEEVPTVEAGPETPVKAEAPVVEEAPAVEVQVPAAAVEEAPVAEQAPVKEEVSIIHTEAPVAEEAPVAQEESPLAKEVLDIEVPAVEEAPGAEVEVPPAEDLKTEAPVLAAEQAASEVATPAPAQEVTSEKAEVKEIPVAEAPSVAQPEPAAEEKPVEAEVSLVETTVTPVVEDKAPEENLPAEFEEAISRAEEEAANTGDAEKPAAEELKEEVAAVAVEESSSAKEETASRETVKEDVEDVAEVEVLKEEQSEATEDASAEAVAETLAEHVEEKSAERAEEVVHVKHEPEPSIDSKVADDHAILASEPLQEAAPAVEVEEVLQEETSVAAPESVVHVEKLEPSAEVEAPAPAEEPITASGVPQENVKPVEDIEPAVVVTLEKPAVEGLHLDLQPPAVESITIQEPTPAVAGDREEETAQDITSADADDSAASQAPAVEDAASVASTEVVVETPNPFAEEHAAASIPSEIVVEEPIVEVAPVETQVPIAEASADNKSSELEDVLLKAQQEEPHIETEAPQAEVEAEALEANNPTADEVPSIVAQPNEISPSSPKLDEEAPAIEAAIEEAEATEEIAPIDDAPAIPLPIDETVAEIPEAVQQPVAEETALEVHAITEPLVPAPTETLEEISAVETSILDTISPAPSEETSALVNPIESTEDQSSNAEEKSVVDVVPTISPETTSVQRSTENTTSVVAPEEPLSVEESRIPEGVAETPVEEQEISINSEAGVEEQPAAQHDLVQDVEKQIDELIKLKEASVAVATTEEESPEGKPVEDSVASEQAEAVQEQPNVEEVPVTGEAVPEQTSTDREIHLALAETEIASPALNDETETIPSTNASLSSTENNLTTADIPEHPSAAKDVESELEFNPVKDEGQLHTEEAKPEENSASASDDLLSPASGAEIERPKSPWTPSFQVTTVGRGVSSSDEDEEVQTPEPEPVKDVPVIEAPVEHTATETFVEVPRVVTPLPEEKDEVSESSAVPSGVETPQLSVDTSSLDTPPAEIARPWTPSYSVHSQGSPLHGTTDLEQEVPAIAPVENAQEQAEDEPELAEMEFSPNEEVPAAAVPVNSEEQIEEPVKVTEQREFVPTEIPAEVPQLSEAFVPVVDDASVDEAPTTSEAAPAALENLRVHVKDSQVDAERSTPTEEDAEGLESALDAVEEEVAATHTEIAQVEESAPTEEVAQVPQLVLDTSEEVTELHNIHESEADSSHLTPQQYEQAQERPASPSWVASYSVSTQGSPLQEHAPLVEEHAPFSETAPPQDEPSPTPATAEVHPEVTVQHDEEQIEEPIEIIEHRDFVAAETPAEESLLSEAPAPVIDDTSVGEAPTTSVAAPAAIENLRVHARELQVEQGPEQSTPAEENTESLESALDAVQEDAVATHEENAAATLKDVQVEQSTPTEVTQVPQLVLDTSEEVTELHNTHESEADSSHLTPQQYEQAQERPGSPSWVASYSVSTQGSPLQEHAPLMEEHVPSSEAAPLKDEPSPSPAAVEAHPEVTVQHDAPRESADSEPQAPAAEDIPAKDVEAETPVEEEVVHAKPSSFTVLVNDAEANAQEDNPPDTSLTLIDDATNLQDPPKSPWTPSYSVTMQGPGTPGEEKELDSIEPLPQRTLDISTKSDTHDNLKAETEVITPAVVEKTLPVDAPVVSIAEESKIPPVVALERELQGIQASINSGGDVTSTANVANVAVVDAAQQEYFPSVETTEQKSKLTKLSVSRLAPVDEVEGLEAGPTTSETVSSPSTRSRLESTTSSRFFPGGWFSTASKVVDEGRTSLEIAQGEFIPSKVTSPVSPPEDISDTPDDASVTSAATGQGTDSEEDEEEPEHKRRWCVVM